MLLKEILTTEFDLLLKEAPMDMPANADLTTQLEVLMARLESAKKALGIANKLTDKADKKKHRSRVMSFMNQLRAMFNKVADALEAEIKADEMKPEYKMAA